MSENFMDFLRKRWYIVVIVVVVLCGLCVGALVLWGVTGPFERFFDGDTVAESATIAPAPTTDGAAPAEDSEAATPTPTQAAAAPNEEALVGTYGIAIRAVLGDLSHVVHIALRRWMAIAVHHSDISFEGPEPWVNVSGTLEDDGSFSAAGQGTVAGYEDIAVTFEGTLIYDSVRGDYVLNGDYIMGAEGGLPGGGSTTYRVEGFRIGALDGTVEADSETIDVFVPALVEAVRSQDEGFLLDRLHPAASAFYGTEACQAYIRGLDDPVFNIDVQDVSEPGPWLWEQGGQAANIPFTYTVSSTVTSGEAVAEVAVHFALINGELHWLPICGEVLP